MLISWVCVGFLVVKRFGLRLGSFPFNVASSHLLLLFYATQHTTVRIFLWSRFRCCPFLCAAVLLFCAVWWVLPLFSLPQTAYDRPYTTCFRGLRLRLWCSRSARQSERTKTLRDPIRILRLCLQDQRPTKLRQSTKNVAIIPYFAVLCIGCNDVMMHPNTCSRCLIACTS